MTDILGNAPEADPAFNLSVRKSGVLSDAPSLAFTAFPLAILTVLGAEVFRGLAYTLPFAPSDPGNLDGSSHASSTYIVVAAILSSAFSLIPIGLGRRGLRRLTSDDPTWIAGVLRAAIALGALALALRSVEAVIVIVQLHYGHPINSFDLFI